jgi:alpha,alpha-trehalase
VLEVEANHDRLRISSRPFTAGPITIAYRGHYRDVVPGDIYSFRLLKPEERDRDENRTARDRASRRAEFEGQEIKGQAGTGR